MSGTNEELANIELEIKQSKLDIKRAECLDRLEKNKDFKELITEGFMEKHAIRQVMLKAHPDMINNEKGQAVLDGQLTAIGHFKQYLVAVYTKGKNAKATIEQDEASREEILKEGLE